MTDVVARPNIEPLFGTGRPSRSRTVAARPVVFLRQVSTEQWVVQDQRNLRGGIFKDFKSAQKFIKSDFAAATTVVVQPRFENTPIQSAKSDQDNSNVEHNPITRSDGHL